MGLAERFVAIHRNLKIHIDLAAEHPGAELIHPHNTFLCCHEIPDFVFEFFAAGGIQHLDDGVFHDVIGYLDDKQADDHAGHRVQHRESHPGTAMPIREPMEEKASDR